MSSIQHIYFCADKKYLPCTATTMASILANAKSTSSIIFHIISDDISAEDIDILKGLSKIKPCKIILHTISSSDFEQYKNMDFGYMSIGSLYRFKIIDYAPSDTDKILYLDGDMIVTESLDELFATDLQNYIAGAVEEKGAFQAQNLQLKSKQYFNAGMLLINLNELRNYDLLQRAAEYYTENKDKIVSHDQDILNGLWDTKIKFLDQKYNVPSFVKKFKNPSIIHYTGFVKKPWHAYCRHPQKNEWLKYSQMTPYKKTAMQLLSFKFKRFLSKIFYFAKDPTHQRYYILNILGMNFGIGKKDNKLK